MEEKKKTTTKKIEKFDVNQACILFALNTYDKKVAQIKHKHQIYTLNEWKNLFTVDNFNIKE